MLHAVKYVVCFYPSSNIFKLSSIKGLFTWRKDDPGTGVTLTERAGKLFTRLSLVGKLGTLPESIYGDM